MIANGENVVTYSVGDYVWAIGLQGRQNIELAQIADAHPRQSRQHTYWLVKIRRCTGWTLLPVERRVRAALTPQELYHQRQLGLVEQRRAGELP